MRATFRTPSVSILHDEADLAVQTSNQVLRPTHTKSKGCLRAISDRTPQWTAIRPRILGTEAEGGIAENISFRTSPGNRESHQFDTRTIIRGVLDDMARRRAVRLRADVGNLSDWGLLDTLRETETVYGSISKKLYALEIGNEPVCTFDESKDTIR